jgi:UDP-2,3-diacylglucosamine pyrophosphatase LpxH
LGAQLIVFGKKYDINKDTDTILDAVARAGFARGFDAVVLGHVHLQLHERLPGGELIVVGDWLELRSFVRLEGGVFSTGRCPA